MRFRGSERDDLWTNVVVATVPAFGKFETKTDRTIPVAVLTPRALRTRERLTSPWTRQPLTEG